MKFVNALMKSKSNHLKKGILQRKTEVLVIIVLLLITAVILYPLYFVLIASFSDPNLVNSGQILFLPKGITFDGYERVFSYGRIWRAYLNTIIYLVLGTFISTTMTLSAGYALSRKDLKIRSFVMILFTLTMVFNGAMIPT